MLSHRFSAYHRNARITQYSFLPVLWFTRQRRVLQGVMKIGQSSLISFLHIQAIPGVSYYCIVST